MRMLLGAYIASTLSLPSSSSNPSIPLENNNTTSSTANNNNNKRSSLQQPRARRASRAPLAKSMSVDETVLSTGAAATSSFGAAGRPSSMLARVSSSSSAVISTQNAVATNMGKASSNLGKDKENVAGKAVAAGPRRVLGDLSNAAKVGYHPLALLSVLTSFCSHSKSISEARKKLAFLRKSELSESDQTLLLSPPSLSLPSRTPPSLRTHRSLILAPHPPLPATP